MPTHRFSTWGLSFVLLSLGLFGLTGCGSTGGQHDITDQGGHSGHRVAGSDAFPVPSEIQPNVDFWRHVYGMWGRGEVAIHDDQYLGVVYEVIKLPAPIQDSYTVSQRELVRARTRSYSDRLRALEERVRAGERLSSSDKTLLAKLEKGGGRGALYGAAERVRSQRGLRERFRRGVEISGRYDAPFREIMRSHGVPEDLAYLPHVESSFQVNARSSVGAAGVWQFMPSTGRRYMNVNDTLDERLDPILAADGAARYLSQAYRRLGSWPLAITSYNHGQAGMANAKAQFGNDIGRIVQDYKGKSFGFASRNFYAEFIAAREVTRNANRYFPEGVRLEEPWRHDRLVLQHGMPADHIANHYGLTRYRLADLNQHWRDPARDGRNPLPAGSTVWLPAGTKQRIASHPPPVSTVMVARSEAKPSPVLRQAVAKVDKPKPKSKPQAKAPAKAQPKVASAPRYHVVKPQETLYRVATQNGLSVAELRRLNKLRPDDNHIRPGQRLKLGI
ncbi:MAG: transglycosylase SLT domain-containing protein [Thiocapsa sp.]|jgi:membrane-bound lytic murein transglycosylase D|nr:lytic transglycosylase domain-containing protein [Thiocapsa sp.]MCG6896574.1 transglycosylase SLT domain-containing protein [Thiocapsa sp.]MCG6985694.1 transglycosylase SLT domain-containing protein [Thiocapsa sp.]